MAVDDTITTEEAEELLKEMRTQSPKVSFKEERVVLECEDTDDRVVFVPMREDPTVQFTNTGAWMVVSKQFIVKDGRVLEVDTGGPFKLEFNGMEMIEEVKEQ